MSPERRPDVVLNIRVIPRAKRSAVAGRRGDAWLVRLQSPPVEGAANDELMELLAATFGVGRRAVSIVSGERTRHKRVRVAGIDADAAEAVLRRVSG
jgi:uncharacterized protein (TIGR00251 family)